MDGRAEEELDLDEWASSIRSNLFEGELGARGEAWVAGQALLVGVVAAAPDLPGVGAIAVVLGLLSFASGSALAAGAAYGLGTSLTPWPKPVEASELKTDGVYSLCRHPIYAGLVLCCGGAGLVSRSYERLLASLVLYLLLSAKAAREEEFLSDKHGELYRAYAAYVPKLFPQAGEAWAFVRESTRERSRR